MQKSKDKTNKINMVNKECYKCHYVITESQLAEQKGLDNAVRYYHRKCLPKR